MLWCVLSVSGWAYSFDNTVTAVHYLHALQEEFLQRMDVSSGETFFFDKPRLSHTLQMHF
jgi:hypothetical protein